MSEDEAVGFGKPPSTTRFLKGRSGNPRGRPRNHHREIPYDAVLGQMVTIREDGRERRITAAEAFLLQLTQKGLAGDSVAARASLDAIEAARAKRGDDADPLKVIILKSFGNGATSVLDTLRATMLKYPTDKVRIRRELNPWLVEAALARFGERRLDKTEQRRVWRATRSPHKVRWPDWWGYFGE